jgi:hypothetical protein
MTMIMTSTTERSVPRIHRAPVYLSHVAEFNTVQNAAEFVAFISIMEGYTIMNLLRDGSTVAFDATVRSAFLDHFSEWADWSTVVRYFNTSGWVVKLDGKPVTVSESAA